MVDLSTGLVVRRTILGAVMRRIEIAKQADGNGVLRGIRQDGSITWQKQTRHAAYFALHDLTHYAVETSLHYGRGFFGLIAEGWDIEDTTGKGSRGPLPEEAVEVEKIVGLFDSERGPAGFGPRSRSMNVGPRPLRRQSSETYESCPERC